MLLAAINDAFADISVAQTKQFALDMLSYLKQNNRFEMGRIDSSGDISDQDRETLKNSIMEYKKAQHEESQ